MILAAILVLPLLTAVLCWIPAIGKRVAGALTLVSSLILLALSVVAVLQVIETGRVQAVRGWLEVDALGVLILLLVTAVAVTASVFSLGYMPATTHDLGRLYHYYGNLNLFIFSMVGVPLLAVPSVTWLAVEFTTLLSVLLVGYESNREALEAAWKYAMLTLTGAAIALFGFLVLFWAMQSAGGSDYTWTGLAAVGPRMSPVLMKTAYLTILVGFGTKVGLVPLHTWLPDAHSQAPTPVCALLSGVETTAILYVILRLMPIAHLSLGATAERWALTFGLISVGVAAFLLIQVHDYKRLFAYSTVEHMGIVCVGAGVGGPGGMLGAMAQIVSHSVTKSFCFYAAGATLLAVGTREIASVRGLIRTSPVAGAALLFGALAIGGAPPFAVFLSEFSIFRAGLEQGQFLVTALLVALITVAFFGILMHVNRMVFGAPPDSGSAERHALPTTCLVALIIAAIPVLVLGVYQPVSLHALLSLAASNLAPSPAP